jgi:hypothetical protein
VAVKAAVNGNDLDARVLGDGTVQLKPSFRLIRGEDGCVKGIVYEHLPPRKTDEVRCEAAEKGFEFIESETRAGQKAEVSMSGTLKLIGEPEGFRLATKIATLDSPSA